MTMCIFWKDVSENIHAATDSRLSNGVTKLDHCLKISRIECDFYECCNESESGKKYKSTTKLAIVFCGGFVSAYTIKESLMEIMNRVTLIPDTSILSMDLISELALSVYKRITPDIISYAVSGSGGCVFYMIGFCEKEKEMQMYKLGCKINEANDGYGFFKEKCFENQSYELDGSGATFLKNKCDIKKFISEAYEVNSQGLYLDILESVINDDDCSSVGGAIQYAKCGPEGPELYSMLKNESDKIKYLRGGVDLNELINETLQYGVMIESQMIVRNK